MTKEDIFSLINIKDYNNVLERILETKDFSEDVKNLLLSMLYKTVKVNVEPLKRYLKDLLNIINNCKSIIIAKPDSQKEKYIINSQKQEIIAYQNEEIMLKALQDLKPKDIVIKQNYELYDKALKVILRKRVCR